MLRFTAADHVRRPLGCRGQGHGVGKWSVMSVRRHERAAQVEELRALWEAHGSTGDMQGALLMVAAQMSGGWTAKQVRARLQLGGAERWGLLAASSGGDSLWIASRAPRCRSARCSSSTACSPRGSVAAQVRA